MRGLFVSLALLAATAFSAPVPDAAPAAEAAPAADAEAVRYACPVYDKNGNRVSTLYQC